MAPALRELEVVAEAERARILAGPQDPSCHRQLLAGMPFARAVEVRPPAAPRPVPAPGSGLRVVAWNAERGREPAAGAALLAGADVALLSELDVGMARSGQRHAARALADALATGYAFGVEFLELGLGDAAEAAAHAGAGNRVGYHGGAILSAYPLVRPELVRLETRGDWFGPERGQRRVGGRIAVLASLELGDVEVALAAVHLDSHGDPDERAAELRVLLDAIEARRPGAPALIGGDLNTHSLGRAELADPERLREALARDPERLRTPLPHEPLFEVAAAAGYEWERCNEVGEPTQRVAGPDGTGRGGLHLDWFLARGLVAEAPEVLPAVDPATGAALSDHDAIAVTIRAG